jgi:phosphoglycolate phosphatase
VPVSVRTVLFDLDGTLADTLPDLAFALNRTLEAEGLEPLSEDAIRPLITEGGRVMVDMAVGERRDQEAKDRMRHAFLDTYRENLANETRLFPEMESVLETLDERRMPWGIVTNKLTAFTDPLVRALGIDRRAKCVVSGDTTSHSKPHPEPMFYACRAAGAKPAECVYLGDAEKDVLAGRRAGMRTLVALYGYLPEDADPHAWGASGVVDSPLGLVRWLDDYA